MNARFAHIAVCVDHSDASGAAVEEAWRLRNDETETFTFVHVVPTPMVVAGHGAMWLPDPSQVTAGAQEWLDELVARYPGSVGVLLSGYPAVEACDWAEENGVDLLVASSSRGLFDRVLLGSFAGYLARHAPCSVLLTRPGAAHASDREASTATAKAG